MRPIKMWPRVLDKLGCTPLVWVWHFSGVIIYAVTTKVDIIRNSVLQRESGNGIVEVDITFIRETLRC